MKCIRSKRAHAPCKSFACRNSVWCSSHRRVVVRAFMTGQSVEFLAAREGVKVSDVERAIRDFARAAEVRERR